MGIQTTPKTPTSLGIRIQYFNGSAWYDMTGTELKALFDAAGTSSYRQAFTTQYESPTAGATVQVTDADDDIFLLLTPSGTIATLTVKLPASPASIRDGQEVKVFSTQIVTALTVNGNGASDVLGEPSALAANGYFTLRYDSQNSIWYRVG